MLCHCSMFSGLCYYPLFLIMTVSLGERGQRQRWQDRDVTNERCSRCDTCCAEVHHRGKSRYIHLGLFLIFPPVRQRRSGEIGGNLPVDRCGKCLAHICRQLAETPCRLSACCSNEAAPSLQQREDVRLRWEVSDTCDHPFCSGN